MILLLACLAAIAEAPVDTLRAPAAPPAPPPVMRPGRAAAAGGPGGAPLPWPVFRDRGESRSLVETGERPVRASSSDAWLGPDKVKHFFTAAFVQGGSYGSLRATARGHGSSLLGASLVTTTAGLLKELSDRRAGGVFSVRDLAWNTAGAAAATLLLERTRR